MTDFTTFSIDTEHARRLAHELVDASQASPTPPPELPNDPALEGFTSALAAAVENLSARLTQVRADAVAVAESSFLMAREAEDADQALASACGGL
ncbi:hypothetical protein [Corynebacterium sp. HMSC05E07]|uniref:hypothetical protein n=1 Tax=Corynebacterium sp. HMSC05E07 TaxID=1581117 RepID=UPI0008A241B7|nr:hypothetical protein [Corynebacterium sp. HMSC05E07]OFT59498.1 hypothetical protein HMPREF3149_09965 [Corynebacterium sp. HMSC05E07]